MFIGVMDSSTAIRDRNINKPNSTNSKLSIGGLDFFGNKYRGKTRSNATVSTLCTGNDRAVHIGNKRTYGMANHTGITQPKNELWNGNCWKFSAKFDKLCIKQF